MGFFGGDDSPSHSEQLMDEQIRANQAELESKRQNLYQEKLDIIKGQGNQVWTPTRSSASSKGGGQSKQPSRDPKDFFPAPWKR